MSDKTTDAHIEDVLHRASFHIYRAQMTIALPKNAGRKSKVNAPLHQLQQRVKLLMTSLNDEKKLSSLNTAFDTHLMLPRDAFLTSALRRKRPIPAVLKNNAPDLFGEAMSKDAGIRLVDRLTTDLQTISFLIDQYFDFTAHLDRRSLPSILAATLSDHLAAEVDFHPSNPAHAGIPAKPTYRILLDIILLYHLLFEELPTVTTLPVPKVSEDGTEIRFAGNGIMFARSAIQVLDASSYFKTGDAIINQLGDMWETLDKNGMKDIRKAERHTSNSDT